MRFDEYREHDAVSLARRIASRQVSAEEVLETAITRAEQVNPGMSTIGNGSGIRGTFGGTRQITGWSEKVKQFD